MKLTTLTYPSPAGDITLGSVNDKLCLCNWAEKKNKTAVEKRLKKHIGITEQHLGRNDLLERAVQQLTEYFSQQRTQFELPILFAGTPFQQQVWQALTLIPYGETSSYQALANTLNQPKAVRAVANANAANALSIIIPCHRIIGSDGTLTGYAGGLTTKKHLLELESTQ